MLVMRIDAFEFMSKLQTFLAEDQKIKLESTPSLIISYGLNYLWGLKLCENTTQ